MRRPVDLNLVAFAEEHRHLLPEGFVEEIDSLESQLTQNIPVLATRAKGSRRSSKMTNARICAAILQELSLFLCTDEPRYQELRGTGRKLTKEVVHFIAGVIVGTLGIASGMAVACVAFVAIACLRVSLATFCRLNPPSRHREVEPVVAKSVRVHHSPRS